MAKVKAKTKAKPELTGDFTDRLRGGADWTDARVIVMPGERREALNTRKRQSPALSWWKKDEESQGFLNRRQVSALVVYCEAVEDAGYGRVKSCLAEPTGGGSDAGQHRQLARRMRLAAMRNRVNRASFDHQAALVFTHEALFPYGSETLDDLGERLIAGSRDVRRQTARAWVALVADAVAEFIEDECRGENCCPRSGFVP